MKTAAKPTGLRYWMLRVLEECDNVAADFSADPVHDLRVSLRRCRSMADGLMAMDPEKDWKAMKKAGKALFQRLGALRDVQIMMEWIEKLELAPARVEATAVVVSNGVSAAESFEVSEGVGEAAPAAGPAACRPCCVWGPWASIAGRARRRRRAAPRRKGPDTRSCG